MTSKATKADADYEIVRVRRRQGRATRTRQKILEAATAEFASSGFNGATTRSIAARADVPHGLVIYHFETKLGVWQAVMENVLQMFHETIRKCMREVEGEDDAIRLRKLHRTFIRFAAERPELNWLMSHEVGNESEESARIGWITENVIGEDVGISIDLIKKAQSRGLFVEGNPALLHYLYVGAVSRMFVLQSELTRTMKMSPFDEGFIELLTETLERLFWRQSPDSLKSDAAGTE